MPSSNWVSSGTSPASRASQRPRHRLTGRPPGVATACSTSPPRSLGHHCGSLCNNSRTWLQASGFSLKKIALVAALQPLQPLQGFQHLAQRHAVHGPTGRGAHAKALELFEQGALVPRAGQEQDIEQRLVGIGKAG
ncbi:hypothetical protein ACFS3C_08820 [Azotobacter vinelandii]